MKSAAEWVKAAEWGNCEWEEAEFNAKEEKDSESAKDNINLEDAEGAEEDDMEIEIHKTEPDRTLLLADERTKQKRQMKVPIWLILRPEEDSA